MARAIAATSLTLRIGLWIAVLALGTSTILLTGEQAILPVLALAAAVLAVSALVSRPELGVLAFAVLLYANAPVNLARIAASSQAIGIAVTALLVVSVLVEVYVRRGGWVLDYPFMGIVAFVGVALLSTLFSRHPQTSVSWIVNLLLEGMLVYLLVINAVRRLATLKRALWSVLAVCAVTGLLSGYQELTSSYQQDFFGLARRDTERGLGDAQNEGEGARRSGTALYPVYRARGPVGEPNRYGQTLLVLLPFGFILATRSRALRTRLLAGALSCALLVGVFLTYSRATMLTLAVMTILMTFLGCLRIRHVMLGLVAALLLIAVTAPGTVKRLSSIRGVQSLMSSETETKADGAIRGRTTAMLAAFNTFLDHPVLGVGPGNYTPHYSVAYMADPEVAFRYRPTQRRAHSLYLEMGAETGAIGLFAFMAIPAWLAVRLWFLRRSWSRVNEENALLASAFLMALVGYFGSAVFLHLAYQRYYWLLLGLTGAAVHLLSRRNPNTAT